MFAVRRLRVPRSLLVALAVAVTVPVLTVPGVASAEDDVAVGDTVVGEFVQLWPEYEDPDEAAEHGDEGPLSFVRTDDGESVRVDSDDVEDLAVGATVEVTVGGEVSDTASEELGYAEALNVVDTEILEAAPEAPPAVAPATAPFTNSVTVVMVNPAGGVRDATRLEDVVNEVNGPVADFWEAESNGAIKIGVVASHDWINTTAGCTNPFALWDEVRARVGGLTGTGARHLLLYVSSTPGNLAGCSYGLGTVGGAPSWGGSLYARDVRTSLIAHEFGHNFGLGHSSALQCHGQTHQYDGTSVRDCVRRPYWDLYDVMGASWEQLGSLNVVQARHLFGVGYRWFEMITAPETVTLSPISQQGGTRGIMLWNAQGTQYWLEFRPVASRDAWLGTPSDNPLDLQPGVLLRQQSSGDDTSLLLDATPSLSTGWDDDSQVALPVGTPFRVYDHWWQGGAAFVITVQSVSASSATVQVTPTSAIAFAHQASGGDAGTMGPPTSAETCVDRMFGGRYCERTYQNGGIYWNSSTRARRVTAPVYAAYVAAGGATGTWGLPMTDTACGLVESGCVQRFQGRVWASSPGTGTFSIRGAFVAQWLATGSESGLLGYPLADQTCNAVTCEQPFQRGTVVSSPDRGALPVYGPIRDAWAAAGGAAGALGNPTTAQGCGMVRGGCGQQFENGSLYWTSATGAHAVTGPIRQLWSRNGWERGAFGFASADMVCGLAGGGCRQEFEGGTATWSAATGAQFTNGAIGAAWAAGGRESGALGYPSLPMGCGLPASGCGQQFQNGSVYWTPTAGAHAVTGPIWGLWTGIGWERGPLRYATGDLECGLTDSGCRQAFQGGTATWSAATGAQFTNGAIGAAWAAGGRESGALGYPSLPMGCGLPASGCGQQFQNGSVYWTPTAGAHAVTGPIWGLWTGIGWERGPLRYATGDLECGLTDGGCRQAFQGGTATWSAVTGAQFTNGAIGAAWAAGGRESGALGYPLLPMGCGMVSSGCGQQFQNGSVYWTPTAGAHAVTGPIWQYWMDAGWERGPLGYASSDLDCTLDGGGCKQNFTGGSVYWTAGTGAHATYGAVRAHWLQQGAELGEMGYPDGEMACGPSSCSQSFQNGTLIWSATAGVQVVKGAIRTAWTASGGDGGPLKGALAPAGCGLPDDGCTQSFKGGTVVSSTTTGAWATYGIIRTYWLGRGGASGSLGYPTGDMTCGPSNCSQGFEGGLVEWSPTLGVRVL